MLRIVLALGLGALVGAACSGGAPGASSASSSSKDADTGSSTALTEGTSAGGGATDVAADGEEVSFEELFGDQQKLVGHTVDVEGTVHFVANCPPPGGQSGPCILNGFFADPDRDFLVYGAIGEAFPMTEDGTLISCGQASAPGGACPGWEQAGRYRIVAVVEPRVSGGRQTEQIELDVRSKTPA